MQITNVILTLWRSEREEDTFMLDAEREFFDSIQANLLATCPGQFVLIKGKELVGTYPTIEDALAEGASVRHPQGWNQPRHRGSNAKIQRPVAFIAGVDRNRRCVRALREGNRERSLRRKYQSRRGTQYRGQRENRISESKNIGQFQNHGSAPFLRLKFKM